MKKIILLLSAVALFGLGSMAQSMDSDIAMLQQYFGVEKIAMLKDYMKLNPQQDSAFWPIYDAYETERRELGKQRIMLINDYMKSISDASSEKATELVNRGVALEVNFKKLQQKYYKKMLKPIGAVKAAQFYQIENYLNNIINLGIQEQIPFIGELEQKHMNTPTPKKK